MNTDPATNSAKATTTLAALLLASSVAGCGPDCPPHGYDAGDRFRITVLSSDIPDSAVLPEGMECPPLKIGDSFELEAGPWEESNRDTCDAPTTVATRSPFGADLVPYCTAGFGGQLGMSCREDLDNGTNCDRKMFFATYPTIKPTDEVIENARLAVEWVYCDQACVEVFTIRIERLGKSP